MTIFEAFLQGLIQGFTEFLPVSSSGHLSLYQYFTGNSSETGFLFSIVLHAGTLIAVCIVFWRTIWELFCEGLSLLVDLVTLRFDAGRMSPSRSTAARCSSSWTMVSSGMCGPSPFRAVSGWPGGTSFKFSRVSPWGR